jgi:hypothetical protein
VTPRETQLEAALRAAAALRIQAKRLMAAYVAPESDRTTIINELIAFFDGSQQLATEALNMAGERDDWRLS